MNPRTRACVWRMNFRDIASLSQPAYARALDMLATTPIDPGLWLDCFCKIVKLRIQFIADGMDPAKGQRWINRREWPK